MTDKSNKKYKYMYKIRRKGTRRKGRRGDENRVII